MNKYLIFFIILIVIGIAVGGYIFYYLKEKPEEQKPLQVFDLNVITQNLEEHSEETGLKVYANGINYYNDKTSSQAPTLISLPLNSSILIYNYNLKNQSYYRDIKTLDSYNNRLGEKVRYIITLKPIPNITITQDNSINSSTKINLNVSVNNELKNILFCTEWSIHVIYVNILDENYKTEGKIDKNNRCYQVNSIIPKNSSFLIPVEYKYFDYMTEKDYLKFSFYNREIIDIDNESSTNLIYSYNLY